MVHQHRCTRASSHESDFVSRAHEDILFSWTNFVRGRNSIAHAEVFVERSLIYRDWRQINRFLRYSLSRKQHIAKMVDYYPRAELKLMDGGHNVGLVDSREHFLSYVSEFLNNQNLMWYFIAECWRKKGYSGWDWAILHLGTLYEFQSRISRINISINLWLKEKIDTGFEPYRCHFLWPETFFDFQNGALCKYRVYLIVRISE